MPKGEKIANISDVRMRRRGKGGDRSWPGPRVVARWKGGSKVKLSWTHQAAQCLSVNGQRRGLIASAEGEVWAGGLAAGKAGVGVAMTRWVKEAPQPGAFVFCAWEQRTAPSRVWR